MSKKNPMPPAKTEPDAQPNDPLVQRRGGRSAVRLRSSDGTLDSKAKPIQGSASRRGDDVRERVLQAALECFGAFGFEGTSTRAVAARAGVSHTLVIYHFKSKDHLWRITVKETLDRYGEEVLGGIIGADDISAKEALARFVEGFVQMSAKVPQIHRILTMASTQGTDRLQWIIDNFLRHHFNVVCELIRRGQKEGTVRQCDPARLYYHIIGAAGTPFTVATEYKALTGRDVFSEAEKLRNIAFIYEFLFD